MDPVLKAVLTSWNWRWDVIAVLTFFTCTCVLGFRRLRKRNPRSVKKWQLGLYLSSQVAIALALISPIDALGTFFFTVHMIQHELLMMVAAPLMLLSNPFAVFLWGLPKMLCLTTGQLFTKRAAARRFFGRATAMVVTLPLYLLILWGWHYPPAFEAALRNDIIHDLQHLSFFLAGLLFWWPVINPAPRVHGHIHHGFRIFYVIAAALPTMLPVMGLALLLQTIIYPYYLAAPRLWGITPLQDQTHGWATMGLVEGIVYLATILLLVAQMAEHEERVERLKERSPLRTRASAKEGMLFLLISLALLVAQPTAWANGGTPKLTGAIVGPYTVSVWTKPEPPRVGRIHVSVAVMRPQDSSPILDARVRVAAEPIHGQENLISANASRSWGLLYDADLYIPSDGRWRIDLQVEGKAGTGSTGFELEVKPPPKVNWQVMGATVVLLLATLALAGWWVIRHRKSGKKLLIRVRQ